MEYRFTFQIKRDKKKSQQVREEESKRMKIC